MIKTCCKCHRLNASFAQRHVVCFAAFLSIALSYTMRACLNLLIVEMVTETTEEKIPKECKVTSVPAEAKSGTVNWSPVQQSTVLVSFFYGYLFTQVPGGYLADTYGAKNVFGISVFFSSVVTVLTPLAVDYCTYEVYCFMRFMMGFVQGPIVPAVSTLMSKWTLRDERGRVGALMYSAHVVGNIICYYISGLLSAYSNEWRTVFYFWAIIGFLITYLVKKFCYSLPSNHPKLSASEYDMLQKELGTSVHSLKTPWCKMLLDPAAVSSILAFGSRGAMSFVEGVLFPNFLKNVLNYSIIEVGLFASTFQVMLLIGTCVAGCIADMHWFPTLFCRRIFAIIGLFGFSSLCQTAFYLRCERTAAIIIFHLGLFASGFCDISVRINILDLTKNFAGSLSSLGNGLGVLGFWPMPYLHDYMAPDNTTTQWIKFFWILTGTSAIATAAYVCTVRLEKAEWDNVEEEQ